jgi:hypothetical protein
MVCLVDITRGGFRLNNATKQFVQNVTLTNKSSTPIPLPLSLVLDPGTRVAWTNSTSLTLCATGSISPIFFLPYLNVYKDPKLFSDSLTSLSPNQSVTVVLQFSIPTSGGITYNLSQVLAGSGSR